MRKTKEERDLEFKAKIDAHVQKVLLAAPPLTDEQWDKIARVLRGAPAERVPRQPSPYELEQQRIAQEREEAIQFAERAAASMLACDVCNLPPVAHRVQSNYGAVGFHDWQPGRAQKLLKGAN